MLLREVNAGDVHCGPWPWPGEASGFHSCVWLEDIRGMVGAVQCRACEPLNLGDAVGDALGEALGEPLGNPESQGYVGRFGADCPSDCSRFTEWRPVCVGGGGEFLEGGRGFPIGRGLVYPAAPNGP